MKPETSATVSAPIRSNGRVTLPAQTRKKLDLSEGDYVVLVVAPLGGGSDD